jgi:hypothetical protein
MSTVYGQFGPASQPNDRLHIAPTQPLRPYIVGRRRQFTAARAASQAKKSRAVVQPNAAGRLIPIWLGIFILLNLGDVVSTWVGLHSGMREGNPLMSTLLAHYGFAALIIYKLLVVLAVTGGVLLLRSFQLSVARVTITICNVLVLLVVMLNVAQYVLS